MKIDLDARVYNVDGTTAKENGKEVACRELLIRALLSEIDGNGNPVRGQDKIKRYDLFLDVRKATNDTDFAAEEISLLKEAVLIFNALAAGQLRELLEGKVNELAPKKPDLKVVDKAES
jgi:hypothetical protein